MSTCDICHADDVVARRSSRGTDAQQRLVVHQQCLQGHRWHLAFDDATNALGTRDILVCDCPEESDGAFPKGSGAQKRQATP